MICFVIPFPSSVPSFNSIHDTLQEIFAIVNSTSSIPNVFGIWLGIITSAVNNPG